MTGDAPATHRWLRGLVFGLVTVGIGVGAHVFAGGSVPGMLVLVLLTGFVGCVCAVLTRSYRRFPVLLVCLGACQVVIHEFLMAGTAGCTLPVAGAVAPAAAMPGMGTTACLPDARTVAMHMSVTPLMMAAHVGATVLAALVMARGERFAAWLWARANAVCSLFVPVLALVAQQLGVSVSDPWSSTERGARPPSRAPPSGLVWSPVLA